MNRSQTTITLGTLLLGFAFLVGCQPQQPLYLFEKGQTQKYMLTKATGIDYPDTEVPSLSEVCNTQAPLTLSNPNPTSYWDLSLEEAIQISLKNSKVCRTLNSVGFSKAGTSGVPGAVLQSPASIGTVYDPAIAESDPRYGVEAALSAFDGQFDASATWTKADDPYPGGGGASQSDTGAFSQSIRKNMATGGSAWITHNDTYQDPFRSTGMVTSGNAGWSTYLEGGFTQPLLQGSGVQFNRIAGFGATTPGFYNGVVIARIQTDQTRADFEMAARNLVADVEKAYWNLYYAYHSLESIKSGRDSAHETWRQTHAMYVIGARGGAAQYEAQSRNNYFAFRAQTETAQGNLFKTENTLRYILGLTSTDGRLLRPIDEPVIAPLKPDYHSILCESLTRSPELRKQKWVVKQREMELIASKNFLLPRLDFTASYRWNGAGRELIIPDNTRDNAYGSLTSGNYAGWMMGLNASMPFGWRKELAGVRNAQLVLARARAILQEQELELSHQIADSFRELDLTYQSSRTHLQRRIAAQAEVSAVNAAYKAGTTTLDQLLDAQKRQAEAETDYYRSVVDYNISIMTLHYRKGSLLEYNNVCLAEGPWPSKAYFDAKRRARERDASFEMNYGYTRPRVVSRGHFHQFQNTQLVSDPSFDTNNNSTPVQQQTPAPQGQPTKAPEQPKTPVIDTHTQAPLPLPGKAEVQPQTASQEIVPAVGTPSSTENKQASFAVPQTASPMVPSVMVPKVGASPTARSNRYLDSNSELPPL